MICQKVFYKDKFDKKNSDLSSFSFDRIFLVRGKASYKNCGAESFINQNFDNRNIDSFFDFDPNPQIDDLKKGIELFKKGDYKLIIAIGGGSVLDMAKLISVFAHQSGDIEDFILKKRELLEIKTPLLAIPTTAGSGADATHFSVVYIKKNKYSVASPAILPDYVYLSSEFSQNANSYLTACTGLDALSQAIESVWSVNSNSESQKFAYQAIETIWKNLYSAVQENDALAKEKLIIASYQAGSAINITKTTAPHAFSYSFTSYYGIPHGHAVALSLPFFLNYNANLSDSDCIDNRGVEDVKSRINKILDILNIKNGEIISSFSTFIESLGININIKELIPNIESDLIRDNINIERLNNNPRKVTEKTISDFLSSC